MASLSQRREQGLSKRIEFLKATRGERWKTIEALVADLDRAGYWKGEPERSFVQKRRHVRKMLAMLVLREDAVRPGVSGSHSLVGKHAFVSIMKADDSGASVRVYKQAFDLTPGELRSILEDKQDSQAYRTQAAVRGRGLVKAYFKGDEAAEDVGAGLLAELTEETTRRAWPEVGPNGRRRVVVAALVQQRHSEEALRAVSERCHAEGFDIGKLLDEYLQAAEASPVFDAREADEIAESTTEYFKVVGELEGLNFGKMCLEALMGARTNAVREFAERERIGFKDAANLLAGELGEHADEFQGVLEVYCRDVFGWTLDEHLQFAIERRSEQA